MSQDAIHEFGRLVVKHVRDEAIRDLDLHLGSKLRTPMALRWRELLTDDASVALARAGVVRRPPGGGPRAPEGAAEHVRAG